MLDFSLVRRNQMTLGQLVTDLTVDDLRRLTNEMIDHQLALIAECDNADVTFMPVDTAANDKFAANEAEANVAWTLGHVIVHVTATSEEKAFLAAEQARGIDRDGRSRYETHWTTVTTIAAVRERLEESRRMRLATLDVWPDAPHLEVTIAYRWLRGPMNAMARYCMGLMHDDDHLGQIADIVGQAHAVRQPA